MLTDFFAQTQEFIRLNDLSYKRYFFHLNSLEHRLSIILGPRGIGKTTVIAQYVMSGACLGNFICKSSLKLDCLHGNVYKF